MTPAELLRARLQVMSSLVLEDGRRWGATAASFQWDGASRVLDPSGPSAVWDSRPRGGSKTTDAAGWCVAAMLEGLPAGSRLYAFATDRDQGRLITDALAGLVQRTPGLAGAVTVDSYKATATRTGCVLEVLAADSASAYGLRPSVVVADEVCQWPATRNARTLWEALYSAMVKVPGSKLACITTSGDPAHWTRKIFDQAVLSPRWVVAETPGPLAWVGAAELDEQRRMLPDSVFARLHLNQWAASEDRLVSPDDLAACVTLSGPQPFRAGVRYLVTLDVGLKHDRTVAMVCHAERLEDGREGRRVALDRLQVWQGSPVAPVVLGEVEGWLEQASRSYGNARIVLDPWQAVGLLQRLRSRSVQVEEFVFSSASVGHMAQALLLALRDHRLALPDDPDLLNELARVRLRETSPGVLRLDHDSGDHDDRAVALGMAVLQLVNLAPTPLNDYMTRLIAQQSGEAVGDGPTVDARTHVPAVLPGLRRGGAPGPWGSPMSGWRPGG